MKKNIIQSIILNIKTLLPFIAMALTMTSCDNDGDNTGSNWLIAILLILAWMKGGRK